MESMGTEARKDAGAPLGFWITLGGAIAGLARRAGCSAEGCPLPEVREVVADLRDWDRLAAAADERPLLGLTQLP
jgi:hypothetical protein